MEGLRLNAVDEIDAENLANESNTHTSNDLH
jgi:hypothetical protein